VDHLSKEKFAAVLQLSDIVIISSNVNNLINLHTDEVHTLKL